MVYIVAYDLVSPNDTPPDYERVISGLKENYKTWCHLEKSVWIIVADQEASEVRDVMKRYIYPTDLLFVAKLSGNWASFNIGANRVEWLKARTF